MTDPRTEAAGNADFPPIDDTPGPAFPLPAERGEQLARAAVRRVRTRRSPRLALQAAASALLALGLAGAAAAAVTSYLSRERPDVGVDAAARGSDDRERPLRPGERADKPAAAAPAVIAPAPAALEPVSVLTPDAISVRSAGKERSRDLLRRANALRARGAFREAERMYSDVARSAADRDDAYAAGVAAASLRLEQLGRPESALALFREALRQRPRGALAEEARRGIAECHRALGDTQAEVRALRELLAAHPSTLLRSRAQARLDQLDGSSH
jgi:tetratricopeptide (TPR) repeat protein